ncbi:MAG: hypothetical protein QOC95_223, partial [Thermoleophilaceae bacterium]|nr:hypothetical protein [Thermoleophilaceae bacterium]
SIALFQAARYSQTCRIFAPMYRQLTLSGIAPGAKVTAAQLAAGYKLPRSIRHVPELPRTASGKLLKGQLPR